MAAVFHVAVSGIPFEAPDYRYVDAGPDWATGGEWGPEGGIPAGLGMVAGDGVSLLEQKRREAEAEATRSLIAARHCELDDVRSAWRRIADQWPNVWP